MTKGRGVATGIPEMDLIKEIKKRPLLYDKQSLNYRKVSKNTKRISKQTHIV